MLDGTKHLDLLNRSIKPNLSLDAAYQVGSTACTVCGGSGCCSTRSSVGSRHAQAGALLDQIFIVGRTEDGSSKVPARTTVKCGRADELENKCAPQLGQNRRRT